MTLAELETWLHRYGQAWEARDPSAVVALFTADAEYFETPFAQPMRGTEGIRTYWANATGKQKDVRFGFEVLACTGDRGIARWSADFSRTSGVTIRLDGVFVLEFSEDGFCRTLREWWHRRPVDREG